MRRNNTPWQPAAAAAVAWKANGDPQSLDFGDVYYSRDDGLAESRYVFLHGNGLPERWRDWPRRRFFIAETGFGTGLNFLLTWQAWLADAAGPQQLHYVSVDKHPLAPADLARAVAAWPQLSELASQLLEQYPGLVPGQHRLQFESGRLTLDLWWEDATAALEDLASHQRPLIDAWYLDGFAPARNQAMWQPRLLQCVASLSRADASFSTFTAAGTVRRQLASAGFEVRKVPGHGRKRECLQGRLAQPQASPVACDDTPWDLPDCAAIPPQTVIVLGAGLAGCTAAAALARRGLDVLVLEQHQLAGAGSGNDQGILYTRLSRNHSELTDFSLQSYCFSTAFYRSLFAAGDLLETIDGALCGTFHQRDQVEEMAQLASALSTVPELAQVLDANQANARLGVSQQKSGYWFPRSGWLKPQAVCRALVKHPRIRLLENCGALGLTQTRLGWQAADDGGNTWDAPCVVIATGIDTMQIEALAWLPLHPIRGQTTQLPTTPEFSTLKAALCHDGYIAPAGGGSHCIGATFNLQDSEPLTRATDHSANLARLAAAVPGWRSSLDQLDPAALEGRVGFRCASPDYLPLAGPVPDLPALQQTFAALRSNAKQRIEGRGQYMPGLYLSTGHGSRGLTSTPLAAELIASMICQEPAPVCRELSRALAPARFIIRDLRRNRI